jgi:hypothetical protein
MLNVRLDSENGKIPFSADALSQAFSGPSLAFIEMVD